jgi:hypothetical protein
MLHCFALQIIKSSVLHFDNFVLQGVINCNLLLFLDVRLPSIKAYIALCWLCTSPSPICFTLLALHTIRSNMLHFIWLYWLRMCDTFLTLCILSGPRLYIVFIGFYISICCTLHTILSGPTCCTLLAFVLLYVAYNVLAL